MRLSEIRGEAALDCMAALIGPATSIMSDQVVKDVLTSDGDKASKARSLTKVLLSDHRQDTVEILAALSMQTPEEFMSEVTLQRMFSDVYGMITDKELLSFLSQQIGDAGITSDDIVEDSEPTG